MRAGGSAGGVQLRAEGPVGGVRTTRVLSDRYRLERMLAKGGNGRVYEATQLPLGRPVAIKMLVPRPGDDEFRARFFLEASTLARLVHRHIVTVHDYGETEAGELFMAMELLEGELLSNVIAKNGCLPSARACRVAIQVCRALRAAHQHRVVHRDLKPANIMLVRDDGDDGAEEEALVKVLDFGLLELLDESTPRVGPSISRPLRLLGSPPYMAPEQIRGEPADPRTDVYALGAVLFHMLTGAPPFTGTNQEILRAHLDRPVIPPGQQVPERGVWPELDAIVVRALAKSPGARHASMHELLGELKAALYHQTHQALVTLDGLDQGALPPLTPAEPPPPREERPSPALPQPRAGDRAPPPLRAPVSPLVLLGLAIGIAIVVLLGLRALMLPGPVAPRTVVSAAAARPGPEVTD